MYVGRSAAIGRSSCVPQSRSHTLSAREREREFIAVNVKDTWSVQSVSTGGGGSQLSAAAAA